MEESVFWFFVFFLESWCQAINHVQLNLTKKLKSSFEGARGYVISIYQDINADTLLKYIVLFNPISTTSQCKSWWWRLLLKKIVASLIRQERTSIASLMIFSMVRAPYKIVCLLITPPGGLWDYLQITDGRTEPEKWSNLFQVVMASQVCPNPQPFLRCCATMWGLIVFKEKQMIHSIY